MFHSPFLSILLILLFTITTPSNYFIVITPYLPPLLMGLLILLRQKPKIMYFEEHTRPKVPSILEKNKKRKVAFKV
jgi:hypothetical protein